MDLTGEHIKTKEDIEPHFTFLIYAHKKKKKRSLMAEKTQEEPANQSKSLTDSDTSDDTKVNPRFKTLIKERQYNTIPGSVKATCIALSHSRAQANPTID